MSELPPNQPPNGPPDGPPTVPSYEPDPTFESEPGWGPPTAPQPPSWGPVEPPPPTGPEPPRWQPEMQPVRSGGARSLPLIVGGLVVLLAVAIGGAFLLTRDDDGSENTAQSIDSDQDDVDSREPNDEDERDPEDPEESTNSTEPESTTTSTEPPTTTVPTTTEPDITPTVGSPEDAVWTFFDAFVAGDCFTAIEFASESVIADEGGEEAMLEDCEESLDEMDQVGGSFILDDVSLLEESGDTATVEITMTVDVTGETTTETDTLDLVLEDGGWKFTEW